MKYFLILLIFLVACESQINTEIGLEERLTSIENPDNYDVYIESTGTGLTSGWNNLIEVSFLGGNVEDFTIIKGTVEGEEAPCSNKELCPNTYQYLFFDAKETKKVMTMKEVAQYFIETEELSTFNHSLDSDCYFANYYNDEPYYKICFKDQYLASAIILAYKQGAEYTFTIN